MEFPLIYTEGSKLTIRVDKKRVECNDYNSSWTEPVSNYTGIEFDLYSRLTRGAGKSRALIYSIILLHTDESKTVTIERYKQGEARAFLSTDKITFMRKRTEEFSRELSLPVIYRNEDGNIEKRPVEDLSKNIKTLLSEGKIKTSMPPENKHKWLKVKETPDELKLSYGGYGYIVLLFVVLSLGISLPLYLFLGKHWYFSLVTEWLFIIMLVGLPHTKQITITRKGISEMSTRFFGLWKIRGLIKMDELEEIRISKDRVGHERNELLIASDNSVIVFGYGFKKDALKWMKNKILHFISLNT